MRQWECWRDVLALGVLGSGVILALLAIKLKKPAGRTKNPKLDPSVSQGLLLPQVPGKIFAGCFIPPLQPCSLHIPKAKKNITKSHPAPQEGTSVSPQDGAGQGQGGLSHRERGNRGQNHARVSLQGIVPGYSMSWLWENKHILLVTQGSPQKGFVTQSKAGHSALSSWQTGLCLWDCNEPLLPKLSVLGFALQGQSLA